MGSEPNLRSLNRALLAWYDRDRRDLPWRGTRDPYAVWVSEVMLQQTQVEAVIPYYARFMALFPTVEALARASLEQVLRAFENLGYYARARNLHAAAQQVASRYQGRVPDAEEALVALPGVGRYTAAAIRSIAFNQPVPALDANVKRVLARVFAVDASLASARTVRRLHELAGRSVHLQRPGDWNQALMDLGARICLPRHPRCDGCPIRARCRARALGAQDRIPVKAKRRAVSHRDVAAAVLFNRQGHVLVVRRAAQGLLGGLWKFPGGEIQGGETFRQGLARAVQEEIGLGVAVKRPLFAIDHAYTHFRITLHVFDAIRVSGRPRALACGAWRWVPIPDLSALPFSKADRQIALRLQGVSGEEPRLGAPRFRRPGRSPA